MQSLVIYLFCDYMYKIQNIKKKKSRAYILYVDLFVDFVSIQFKNIYIYTKKNLPRTMYSCFR